MNKMSMLVLMLVLIFGCTKNSERINYTKKTITSYDYSEVSGEIVESCEDIVIINYDNLGRIVDSTGYDCDGIPLISTKEYGEWSEKYKYTDDLTTVTYTYGYNGLKFIDSLVFSPDRKESFTYSRYSENGWDWEKKTRRRYNDGGELVETVIYDESGEIHQKEINNRKIENVVFHDSYIGNQLFRKVTRIMDKRGNHISLSNIKYHFSTIVEPDRLGEIDYGGISTNKLEYNLKGNLIKKYRYYLDITTGYTKYLGYREYKYNKSNNIIELIDFDSENKLEDKTIYRYEQGLIVEEIKYKYDYPFGEVRETIKNRETIEYK
jgi:hypothetical protein